MDGIPLEISYRNDNGELCDFSCCRLGSHCNKNTEKTVEICLRILGASDGRYPGAFGWNQKALISFSNYSLPKLRFETKLRAYLDLISFLIRTLDRNLIRNLNERSLKNVPQLEKL